MFYIIPPEEIACSVCLGWRTNLVAKCTPARSPVAFKKIDCSFCSTTGVHPIPFCEIVGRDNENLL